jgi:hypothetical protein
MISWKHAITLLVVSSAWISFTVNSLTLALHALPSSSLDRKVSLVSSLDSFRYSIKEASFDSALLYPLPDDYSDYLSDSRTSSWRSHQTTPQLFDREYKLIDDDVDACISNLAGEELSKEYRMMHDMKEMMEAMMLYPHPSSSSTATSLVCRLALMSTVRCPKWHEDYVTARLVKSYYGLGTEWVDPNDELTRFLNWRRQQQGDNLSVAQEKIRKLVCGDTMVMSGKNRVKDGRPVVPVLHRSPEPDRDSDDCCQLRLLFTITIA